MAKRAKPAAPNGPNKYLAIVEDIRDEIRRGRLRPGDRIPSQYELAARYGVTKDTANKAAACLAAQGYVKRLRGKAGTIVVEPARSPSRSIGFLMTLWPNVFYSLLLNSAQHVAFHRGYSLQFYAWPQIADLDALWRLISESNLAGMLITDNSPHIPMPFPVVYLNHFPREPRPNEYSVNADQAQGGRLIARALIAKGHTDIVYLTKPISESHFRWYHRAQGFIQEYRDAGINISPRVVEFTNVGSQGLQAVIQRIMRLFPTITALAAHEDGVASMSAFLLQEMGYRVPKDISITGFDRYHTYYSRINSIVTAPEDLAARATNTLIDVIEKKPGVPRHETLPVAYYEGETLLPAAENLRNRAHRPRNAPKPFML